MSERMYLFTSGEYSDYGISGLYLGPSVFDFKAVHSRWQDLYNTMVPDAEYYGLGSTPRYGTPEYETWFAEVFEPARAKSDAQKAAFAAATGGSEFQDYLVKEFGFKEVKTQEIHVDPTGCSISIGTWEGDL